MNPAARRPQLIIDARWVGDHGVGRFAREIIGRFPEAELLDRGPDKLSPVNPLFLWRHLKSRRPALFFSPGFNPPAGRPAPFIFTIHDLIHLEVAEERSPLKTFYYQTVVKPACRRAERVMTVSEFSRARICNWAGLTEDRVVVAGCGVSEAFTPEGPRRPHRTDYLLFVGNAKPHKNLAGALTAFAGLARAYPVDLLVCAPRSPALEQLVRAANPGDRVFLTGTLSDEDLAAAYRGAVALVFPSFYEGFGLPVAEAMACGTPVVASTCTSIGEVAGDAAIAVQPDDPETIEAGLRKVLNDESLRKALSAKGLERARRFRWDQVADTLRRTFEAVTAAP